MDLRGGRLWERIAMAAVTVLTVVVMIASLGFERRIANQKLLFYQLQTLRTSVNLFKAMAKRNPESLTELAEAEYRFPGEEQRRRYLSITPMNENSAFVDPFGHPYGYDVKSGWVKSQTPGYEYW